MAATRGRRTVTCIAVEADPVVVDFDTEACLCGCDGGGEVRGLRMTQHVRERFLEDQIDVASLFGCERKPRGVVCGLNAPSDALAVEELRRHGPDANDDLMKV